MKKFYDKLTLGKECKTAKLKNKKHFLRYKGIVYEMEFGSEEWLDIQFMAMTYKNTINLHLDKVYETGGEKWQLI